MTDQACIGRAATGPLSALFFCGLLASAQPAEAASRCPNLALLLDQSTSMKQTPAGLTPMTGELSKWQIATAALTNLNNKYDGLLPLGYANFPYRESSCDTRGFNVPVGYGHRVDINYAMITYPWNGGSTPTCTAVSNLAAEPLLQDPTRTQYVLLVTDGAPEAACCGADPVKTSVDAITAAANQSPPIKTIVVGFGNLPANEQSALNQMAVAGGMPDNDPNYRYYKADNQQALDAALTRILNTLVGGDAGEPIQCEDGCYGTPCATGQVCLQNTCKPNPCASQSCPDGQSCLFDGTNASCVAACTEACPLGSRCNNGHCIADPCGGPCPSGQLCSKATNRCEADPKCQNIVCHNSQGCFGGVCVDNPCAYTTCPSGTQCVDFSGMCMPPRPPDDGSQDSGCQCDLAHPSRANAFGPLAALLIFAGFFFARRRSVSSR